MMAISVRQYIVSEDGVIRRVPRRVAEGLTFGRDAIPDYANTRQKVAEAVIENENGRPVRILDVRGSYWTFDDKGQIGRGLSETVGDFLDLDHATRNAPKAGKVVDLVPEIRKKDLQERHRWTVTTDDLDRIAADLWPGIHGPAPDVTVVKGKAPKKPPLSYEAKRALDEIERHIEMIRYHLQALGEHALKGLEFEARRTATYENPALWRGVAEAAEHQRQVRIAHRTGKGEWYAVLEATMCDGPIIERELATAHEKCATREKAIEAGKRLMEQKAEWLGPEVRLDVVLYSALEWAPQQE